MKILLIKPKWFVHGGIYRYLENIKFTPINLAILAALSGDNEVEIIDGDWEELPYNEGYDIVGISVTTFTSQLAYEISEKYRRLGSKVIMGGVHPSLMPGECLEHCDSVVIGEAEYVWKEILNDYKKNELKKIYQATNVVDMNDVPFPKRELLKTKYLVGMLEATRGCINSCRFCYLPNVPWHKFRKRDTDLVYEELKNLSQKLIFFVDDNLFADQAYAIELFNKIKPLRKSWSIQAPTNITENEELINVMSESGCFNVQVGFQTVNPKSLNIAKVMQNRISAYKKVVNMFHKYHILVTGFFMFGFDTDDKSIFEKTIKVIKEIDIDEAHLYILTPYPGTDIYEQLKEEDRLLLDKDRTCYGWANAVFKPKLMTPEELEDGVRKSYNILNKHFKKKFIPTILKNINIVLKCPSLMRIFLDGITRQVKI